MTRFEQPTFQVLRQECVHSRGWRLKSRFAGVAAHVQNLPPGTSATAPPLQLRLADHDNFSLLPDA